MTTSDHSDEPAEGQRPLRAALADELFAVARALRDTLDGAHLDDALDQATDGLPGASSPPVRDMAHAAMRSLGTLQALAARLNRKPPAPVVAALQWAALSELRDGRRAAPIVIDQAVRAAHALPQPDGHPATAAFLNATLRRYLRERAEMDAAIAKDAVAQYNHPGWWIRELRSQRPRDWSRILQSAQHQAPLSLRLNRRSAQRLGIAPEAALAALDAAGIGWCRLGVDGDGPGPSDAIALLQARPVDRIPGFVDGLFTVQDAGAQCAAEWLAPRDGEHILDACAAPGGKTTHLLQLARCSVVAVDPDGRRLPLVAHNVEREHGASPAPGMLQLRRADAAETGRWWDGRPFDRILVDAPCSASGIVRRHPDVPWHRSRRDITTLARRQQHLLDRLWPLLKPGGTLLYVTCSIFPEEGDRVVSAFSATRPRGLDPASIRMRELLPTRDFADSVRTARGPETVVHDHDGYFFALLSKTS